MHHGSARRASRVRASSSIIRARAPARIERRTRAMGTEEHEPLSSLGWRGRASYDDTDVAALRQTLQAEAGIPNIQDNVVHPSEPDYAGA